MIFGIVSVFGFHQSTHFAIFSNLRNAKILTIYSTLKIQKYNSIVNFTSHFLSLFFPSVGRYRLDAIYI